MAIGKRKLDVATLTGIVAAFGLVIVAIKLGGGLSYFFDAKALLIVLGGTLGATLVNFPLRDFSRAMPALKTAFFPDQFSTKLRTSKILDYARKYRASGPESVQAELRKESNRFLRDCIELLTEGHGEDEIRKVLEIELGFSEDRHRRSAQLFQTMGTIAPAMGLVGTLIGLVQMLQNLDSPSGIGPAMAVALLTTFYGALFANLVFLPIAGKLRSRSEEEFLLKELTIEGIAGVAAGANPRVIERRLLSFLPPEQRQSEYE